MLIVTHGSPSAPARAERAVRALADRVAALVPGVDVRGATLAARGALEAALDGTTGQETLVYPMFMADGWFVSTALPQRLAILGSCSFRIARPFGRDPAVWALCRDAAANAAFAQGWRPAETAVLLAAHGSPSDRRPRDVAEQAAAVITAAGLFRSVTTGFIDEAPSLVDAARIRAPAVCVPFFAMRAGHVARDVPEALHAAGFEGATLDPVGLHPHAPRIIAAALQTERACVPA